MTHPSVRLVRSTILAQLEAYQKEQRQRVVSCDANITGAQVDARWFVGLSGGLDSIVLLHALTKVNEALANPLSIVALHIHHQLSPNADSWQRHCQHFSRSLGVEFITQKVEVKSIGSGIEAAARDARYQVFETYIQANDCLLLAHHQDDQAETVLLRLFRGAGVRGLAAMPLTRPLGLGHLLRPLLSVSREQILAYAEHYSLAWVEDESNQQVDYDRNYVRNDLTPRIAERWPKWQEQAAKTAAHLREADGLLQQLAQADLRMCHVCSERMGVSIDATLLQGVVLGTKGLSAGDDDITFVPNMSGAQARLSNLVRGWCLLMGYSLPESTHLQQITEQCFSSSKTAHSLCVSWSGTAWRYFSGRWYLSPLLPQTPENHQKISFRTDKPQKLRLGDGFVLEISHSGRSKSDSFSHDKGLVLPSGSYHVQWRKGGERCTPEYRQHSQTLKKLLQEYGLETWLRPHIPLIYDGNELVAVGDLWLNKALGSNSASAEHLPVETIERGSAMIRWFFEP